MSFHTQTFANRFNVMGDEAEGIFESLQSVGCVRFGLNRPPIGLKQVPPFIRYTPDYLQHDRLVEVQGVGGDGLIKLKCDKHAALLQWNSLFPVDLFVWDSKNRRATQFPILDFPVSTCQLALFPEGKPYFALPVATPELDWVEVPNGK